MPLKKTKQIKTLKGLDRNLIVNFKQIHVDRLIKLKKFSGSFTGVGPGLDKNANPSTGLFENFKDPNSKGSALTVGTRRGMELLLELEEGTLKATSPYWTKYYVRMDSDTLTLDLTDDTDLLKYLFLRGQNIVADGLEEIELNSRSEFVLYSEEQEALSRVEGRSALKRAYKLADDLDIATKLQILSVYGVNVDATQTNTITNKIDEKLEADPEKFLALAEDDNLIYKSLLSKCLDAGIITAKEGSYYHNEIVLGFDKESTVKVIISKPQLAAVLKAKLSGDMELIQQSLNLNKEVE